MKYFIKNKEVFKAEYIKGYAPFYDNILNDNCYFLPNYYGGWDEFDLKTNKRTNSWISKIKEYLISDIETFAQKIDREIE